jgi:hypothetical protein
VKRGEERVVRKVRKEGAGEDAHHHETLTQTRTKTTGGCQ